MGADERTGRTAHRGSDVSAFWPADEGVRKYAVELIKTKYADFGPTLATEVLLEKHRLRVDKETPQALADGL